MGRLIDADKFEAFVIHTNGDEEFVNGVQYVLEKIDNAPTVEAIPKADYENRLKTDLVAMLTELQLEIEEKEQYYQDKFLESKNAVHDAAMGGRMFGCGECKELVQQKINSLKEK